jgi:4-diphosphocytidyl-2-C-methyl-D-erythritol kinase
LGGGCSNAAAVLKILNSKYGKLSEEELAKLAHSLGADVPFFLNPAPSVGKGTGEILTHLEFSAKFAVILVNPLFPVTAAWGYSNYIPCSDKTTLDGFIRILQAGKLPEEIVNDLSNAVFRKFPIMGMLRDSMLDAGAGCIGMSGSGPTLFGICELRSTAESAVETLKKRFGNSIYCTTSSILH